MGPMTFLVAATLVGFQFGWEPRPEGGCQYIIELNADALDALRLGKPIESDLRPELLGEVRSIRIVMGDASLPQRLAPRAPAALPPNPASKPLAEHSVAYVAPPPGGNSAVAMGKGTGARGQSHFRRTKIGTVPRLFRQPSRGCRSGLPWSPSSPPWAETSSSPGSLGMPATATAHSWDQPSLDRMVDILRQSRSLLMITGAGISAAEEEGGMKDESRVEARLRFRNRPSPVRPPPY